VLVQRHFSEITFPATSVTKFLFWREHSRDFESMTAYGFAFSGVGVNLTGAGEPEHLRSLRVSADFFRTLGVQPVLGRSFTEDEDRPGGPNAVVLSYALWQRRFGADSGIVGRPIRLGGQLWTVVGIASKEFAFTPTADVWIPLRAQPNPNDQTNDADLGRSVRVARHFGRICLVFGIAAIALSPCDPLRMLRPLSQAAVTYCRRRSARCQAAASCRKVLILFSLASIFSGSASTAALP
jgi:MacB-like periplasmic core domain